MIVVYILEENTTTINFDQPEGNCTRDCKCGKFIDFRFAQHHFQNAGQVCLQINIIIYKERRGGERKSVQQTDCGYEITWLWEPLDY